MTTRDVTALLDRFPKTRPVLPPKLQAIYLRQYTENRSGKTAAASAAQRLEAWMHRQVAADVQSGPGRDTLELGAGMLNQLAYEPAEGAYDIVEPFTELYAGSPLRIRLRDVFADVADVPATRRYQRITTVAALEHICDLPLALARTARLLATEGSLRAAIPSEGGFLWRVGWSLTTGLEFRLRYGLDYGLMMAHEHVNNSLEVEGLVRALFAEVTIRSFGIGRQLSLYRFIVATAPRLDVADAWIARFGAAPRPAAAK